MVGYPAGYPDRAGGSADIVVLLQLVGEKCYFRQTRRILQRYETHYLAVTGFRPAGGGDKTGYRDFPVYEPVESGSRHVFGPEQYRRMYAERDSGNIHLGFQFRRPVILRQSCEIIVNVEQQ